MKDINKFLAIGLLLAVLTLTTIGGVVFAQDNVVPLQQRGWCHGADGVCDGVCQNGVCQSRATGSCSGCPRTITPPAVK